jgi:hypothetical protein
MRTPKQSSGADAQVQMPVLPQSDPAHRARGCSLLLGHKRERAQHRAAIASAMFTEAKPIYQPSRRRQRRPLQPTSAVARCRACQREAAAGGHDKRNKISGHANGEELPTGSIGRPERPRERSVHSGANARQNEGGGLQQVRSHAPSSISFMSSHPTSHHRGWGRQSPDAASETVVKPV